MARPRKHDRPAIMRAVCARVADGELVKDVAEDLGTTAATIRKWAADDPAFGALYARAREEQAHALAEQALSIAAGDDAVTLMREAAVEDAEDELRKKDKANWYKKVQELRQGIVQRDRMRVDTIKWLTSKIAPRAYGERIQQEVTGSVTVEHVWKFGTREVRF